MKPPPLRVLPGGNQPLTPLQLRRTLHPEVALLEDDRGRPERPWAVSGVFLLCLACALIAAILRG